MKHLNRIFYLILVTAMGISISVNAQSKNNQKKEVALDGYCPVAYVAMKKAVKGKQEYSTNYKGKTYHFAAKKAVAMFEKDPSKFLPSYDGYCATAMSMGKEVKSDPKIFSLYKGHTYLFSTEKAKEMFDKDPEMYIKKGDKEFAQLNK